MLAAAQRLRRQEDFAATIRRGRRAGRGTLVVHYLQSDHLQTDATQTDTTQTDAVQSIAAQSNAVTEPVPADQQSARAGFVVSKAVGNAVVRNAVKRRLRHLVRARVADLPAGVVIVVWALPEAATSPYKCLEKDFDLALEAVQRAKSRGARR